jgi:hypothetical protein
VDFTSKEFCGAPKTYGRVRKGGREGGTSVDYVTISISDSTILAIPPSLPPFLPP